MGVYLLSLGIAGVVLDGRYCQRTLDWRSSGACQALGSIVVISSEASVFTIVTLTSCRLFAVFKVSIALSCYSYEMDLRNINADLLVQII